MNPPSATAFILLVDIADIRLSDCLPYVTRLSASEQARFHAIVRELRKVQFLVGRMLLRSAVMRVVDCSMQQITVVERQREAPLLQFGTALSAPFFSISHTGNWVGCACSKDVALGLDMEQFNVDRKLEAIAKHTFSESDRSWFDQQAALGPEERVAAFYLLWSEKEARFKLTGQYTVAPVEHCYEVLHPAMSVVLMSAAALTSPPACHTLDFKLIESQWFARNGSIT